MWHDLATAFLLPLREKVAAQPTDEGYAGEDVHLVR